MKKILALAIALVMALSLTAFAEIELRAAWWGGQERHNNTMAAMDAYAEANGIKIGYEPNSWSSYFETLATQSVGKNLPDILQMSTTDIINYATNGQIVDLYQFVDEGIIDLTYVDPASLSGGTVDGKLAGFTTGTNTVTVIYNKAIFDQAGVEYPADDWTWSDYIATVQEIYEATGIQSDIPFLTEARWVVETWVRAFGYDFFSEDGKSLPWADDEAVKAAVAGAIQDIYDGVKAGWFIDPEVQLAWATTEENYIVQGKSACAFLLSNYYGVYAAALDADKGELGMAMLPTIDDGTQSGMYLNSNMYWCISANSQYPEEAAKLLNYMINSTDAAAYIGTDRGISLSSAVRDFLANSETTDAATTNVLNYVSAVSKVVSTVNPADPANSAEPISVLKVDYQAVMYGEMSAEDCVKDFVEQATVMLAK
ncbi:MAG: extracellular solute-binding protein [Clostridia bacterium]|nr:extracellular solute-binding protein [Clostridia bacterium]